MKSKRRQEADHPVWDALTGLGQRPVFAHVGTGEHIESPADPLQLAGSMESAEIDAGDTVRFEIPWTQNPGLFDQFQHLVRVCGSSSHIDTNVTLHREKLTSPDEMKHFGRRLEESDRLCDGAVKILLH